MVAHNAFLQDVFAVNRIPWRSLLSLSAALGVSNYHGLLNGIFYEQVRDMSRAIAYTR